MSTFEDDWTPVCCSDWGEHVDDHRRGGRSRHPLHRTGRCAPIFYVRFHSSLVTISDKKVLTFF